MPEKNRTERKPESIGIASENRHPAVFPSRVAQAGLRAHKIWFIAFPSRTIAQWHVDEPTLAYRCGGSTGIVLVKNAPVSQFHLIAKNYDVGT